MTDAKPLSAEELRWFNTRHLFDSDSSIARLVATIRRDRELIRWLYRNMSTGNRQAIEFAGANHTDDLAPEILAIVEAGDE